MTFSLLDFGCWLVVFLISLSAHEAGHAWTASLLGDATAARAGLVTLDPTPHIRREPFGMLVVPIISYLSSGWMLGWASAPLNLNWASAYPRRAALTALAGPAVNFMTALLGWLLLKSGCATGVFLVPSYPSFSSLVLAQSSGLWHLAAILLSLSVSLNLLLGVFNLIPLPPLDGSVLPLFFLPHSLAKSYQNMIRSRLPALLGLVLAWKIFPQIYRPLSSWLGSSLQ